MDFFKHQSQRVNSTLLETTVQRLYQTYKYELAKGGLTSSGRKLEVPGMSIVDSKPPAINLSYPMFLILMLKNHLLILQFSVRFMKLLKPRMISLLTAVIFHLLVYTE